MAEETIDGDAPGQEPAGFAQAHGIIAVGIRRRRQAVAFLDRDLIGLRRLLQAAVPAAPNILVGWHRPGRAGKGAPEKGALTAFHGPGIRGAEAGNHCQSA